MIGARRRRIAASAIALAASLAACDDAGAPIPDVDLAVRVAAGADEVDLGRAFPLTVVRVWAKDLEPAAWDDRALAPLAVRLEGVDRREDGRHVEETRRYRGYAFARSDVTVVPPTIRARRPDGAAERAVAPAGVRLRVRPLLDAAAPGAPELPGEPMSEPFPRWPGVVGVMAAVAAIVAGVARRRRGGAPAGGVATANPEAPRARALAALDALAARASIDDETIAAETRAVADLVRDDVGRRLGADVGPRSTPELLARVEGAAAWRGAPVATLGHVLARCDAVKFAAHAPPAAAHRALLADARACVAAPAAVPVAASLGGVPAPASGGPARGEAVP